MRYVSTGPEMAGTAKNREKGEGGAFGAVTVRDVIA